MKNRESVGMISRLPLFCDNEQIDYFLASSAIECTLPLISLAFSAMTDVSLATLSATFSPAYNA